MSQTENEMITINCSESIFFKFSDSYEIIRIVPEQLLFIITFSVQTKQLFIRGL